MLSLVKLGKGQPQTIYEFNNLDLWDLLLFLQSIYSISYLFTRQHSKRGEALYDRST